MSPKAKRYSEPQGRHSSHGDDVVGNTHGDKGKEDGKQKNDDCFAGSISQRVRGIHGYPSILSVFKSGPIQSGHSHVQRRGLKSTPASSKSLNLVSFTRSAPSRCFRITRYLRSTFHRGENMRFYGVADYGLGARCLRGGRAIRSLLGLLRENGATCLGQTRPRLPDLLQGSRAVSHRYSRRTPK